MTLNLRKLGLWWIFRDFGLRRAFQEWIAAKWLEIDQDNLHTKFSSLNVDFSSPSSDPPDSKRPAPAGVKKGTLLKSVYLSVVVLSSVKMIADWHRHAAYHNKHWWKASYECQHRWPWMTMKPKNINFKWFLAICGCKKVNCDETDGDRPRLPANRNCHRVSRFSWALAQISCFYTRKQRLL